MSKTIIQDILGCLVAALAFLLASATGLGIDEQTMKYTLKTLIADLIGFACFALLLLLLWIATG